MTGIVAKGGDTDHARAIAPSIRWDRTDMRLRHLPMILLASAPLGLLAAEPKAPELAVESYKLANGLKVALHRDPSIPRVTVAVAFQFR